MRPSRHRVVVPLAALTLVAAAACGSQDDGPLSTSGNGVDTITDVSTEISTGGGDDGGGPVALRVVEHGFSVVERSNGARHVLAAAAIEHDGPATLVYVDVEFELADGTRAWIMTEADVVSAIGPGQIAYSTVRTPDLPDGADPTTLTVTVSHRSDVGFPPGAQLPVSVDGVTEGDIVGVVVVGSLTNVTGSELSLPVINCALYNGGEIVGGTHTYISERVAPGATAEWTAPAHIDMQMVDSARCTAGSVD